MLLQFSVENFKSFKNKTILSLEASTDSEHKNNYSLIGKDKCLKVISMFGANAAGKSNIFQALTVSILLVRNSNQRQIGEIMSSIVPYKFDMETQNNPTSFEFIFIVDATKYVYGFSATQHKIFTEYLYVYKTAKASVIFERDENKEEIYKFTNPKLKKELLPLTKMNTENKLFLATATAWNCEETRIPFTWFQTSINVYTSNYRNFNQIGYMLENDSDHSLHNFIHKVLKEADINIYDFEFESRELKKEQLPENMQEMFSQNTNFNLKQFKINTTHQIKKADGNIEYHSLNINQESIGTQNLFYMSPIIKQAFDTGETICIDEFDNSLHPMIVLYLIRLFNNPEINKANAQLVISTHTMDLLDLKILRRDQIYFVEKDNNTGISELYSLDEFSPRTREDIRKAYLLGRYGSIPNVQDGDICD